MARRSRHSIPGSVYHVMLRGNNAQPIFSTDADRRYFYLLMQEAVLRYKFQIIAFCLMSNHVHLAIRIGETPISKIMQNLSFRYTRYFNYNNNLVGHLFQGRFKSILVGGLGYLRQLIRYIHLNPVRANMVNDPVEYPWSSHHAYLMRTYYEWLSADTGLQFFGENRKEAVEWYHQFVMAGIGRVEEIDFKKGVSDGIVGDELFIETMKDADLPDLTDGPIEITIHDLLLVLSEWAQKEISELSRLGVSREDSHIRNVAAYLVQCSSGVNMTDLADFFDRADNTLAQAAKRLELKLKNSEQLKAEIDQLRRRLITLCRERNLEEASLIG